MDCYYEPNKANKFRGRPRATLPSTLFQDIQRTVGFKLKHDNNISKYNISKLKSKEDIESLRYVAFW